MAKSKIQSILISDPKFRILLNKDLFGETANPNDEFITDLVQGIYHFGVEEFKNRLYRITFTDSLVDLIWYKNYTIILSATRHDESFKEAITYNQFLDDLIYDLKEKENIIQATEFIKEQVNLFNDNYFDIDVIGARLNNDLNITMSYVCNISAVPITYLQLDEDGGDPMLIGPMLTAMSTFSRTVLDKAIESIQIGYNRIFLNWTKDRLYSLITKDKRIHEFYDPVKQRRIKHILKEMSQTIDLMGTVSNEIETEELNLMMHSFITNEMEAHERSGSGSLGY